MRRAGPDYRVSQPDPADHPDAQHGRRESRPKPRFAWRPARRSNTCVSALTNLTERPRRIELTSYRELAVHEYGAYLRDPDFNAMHVETWFVRGDRGGAGAQPAAARQPAPTGCRTRPVSTPSIPVRCGRLVAYEDSRTRFIGPGGLREPRGLGPEGRRDISDEGGLYTFDPAACLTVAIELPAKGRAEVQAS